MDTTVNGSSLGEVRGHSERLDKSEGQSQTETGAEADDAHANGKASLSIFVSLDVDHYVIRCADLFPPLRHVTLACVIPCALLTILE